MLRQRSGAAAALWRIHAVQDLSVARQHWQFSSLPDSVLYEDDQHNIRDSLIPKSVWDCLHQLRVAGHEVFLVGGAVRDLLLQHQQPKDFDLLTSAQLQKVGKNDCMTPYRASTATYNRQQHVQPLQLLSCTS